MKKAIISAAVIIAVICAAAVIFIYPDLIKEGVQEGLLLCAQVIIPSMFIFAVIADFAAKTGAAEAIARPISFILSPLLRIPKCACGAVLMSFISGYPVGAAGVKQLITSGKIDKKTAERMLAICANASPPTVIVAIGGLLGNFSLGWIMYLSHIAASLIIGVALAIFAQKPMEKEAAHKPSISIADAFVNATADASSQMLIICAFVVLFCAVGAVVGQYSHGATAILEVTNGARLLINSGGSLPLIAGLIGFGGVSVICQIMSIARGISSFAVILFERIANGIISAAICQFVLKLFGGEIEVLSNLSNATPQFAIVTVPVTLSMLCMAATFLAFAGRVWQKN